MAFEKQMEVLKHSVQSTRRLATKILKDERDVAKDQQHINNHYTSLQNVFIPKGDSKETEKALKDSIKELKDGFFKNFEIEKLVEIYDKRQLDLMHKDDKEFNENIHDLKSLKIKSGLISNPGTQKVLNDMKHFNFKGCKSEDDFRKELYHALTRLFQQEQKIEKTVEDQIKKESKLSHDQRWDRDRLRSLVIGIAKVFNAKHQARLLRKGANKEKDFLTHIEDSLEELDKIIKKKEGITETKEIEKVMKLITEIVENEEGEIKVTKVIMVASEYIFRFAIYTYFKLEELLEQYKNTVFDVKKKGFNLEKVHEFDIKREELTKDIHKHIINVEHIAKQIN